MQMQRLILKVLLAAILFAVQPFYRADALSELHQEGVASIRVNYADKNVIIFSTSVTGQPNMTYAYYIPEERILWRKEKFYFVVLDSQNDKLLISHKTNIEILMLATGKVHTLINGNLLRGPHAIMDDEAAFNHLRLQEKKYRKQGEEDKARKARIEWEAIAYGQVIGANFFSLQPDGCFAAFLHRGSEKQPETRHREWVLIDSDKPKALLKGLGVFLCKTSNGVLFYDENQKRLSCLRAKQVVDMSKLIKLTDPSFSQIPTECSEPNHRYGVFTVRCKETETREACVVFDSRSDKLSLIRPNDNRSSTWHVIRDWVLRRYYTKGEGYIWQAYDFTGEAKGNFVEPKAEVGYTGTKIAGVTSRGDLVLLQRPNAAIVDYRQKTHLKFLVLALPDMRLTGETIVTDHLLGRQDTGKMIFRTNLYCQVLGNISIVKMDKPEQRHILTLRAINVYTGKIAWQVDLETTIHRDRWERQQ